MFETIQELADRLYREKYNEGYADGATASQALKVGTRYSSIVIPGGKSQAYRKGYYDALTNKANPFAGIEENKT